QHEVNALPCETQALANRRQGQPLPPQAGREPPLLQTCSAAAVRAAHALSLRRSLARHSHSFRLFACPLPRLGLCRALGPDGIHAVRSGDQPPRAGGGQHAHITYRPTGPLEARERLIGTGIATHVTNSLTISDAEASTKGERNLATRG